MDIVVRALHMICNSLRLSIVSKSEQNSNDDHRYAIDTSPPDEEAYVVDHSPGEWGDGHGRRGIGAGNVGGSGWQ